VPILSVSTGLCPLSAISQPRLACASLPAREHSRSTVALQGTERPTGEGRDAVLLFAWTKVRLAGGLPGGASSEASHSVCAAEKQRG